MSVSGAVGLAVLTFVLGLVFGRLLGRSGPQVRSFGNETGLDQSATPGAGPGSFESAQRTVSRTQDLGQAGPGDSRSGDGRSGEGRSGAFGFSGQDFEAPGAASSDQNAAEPFRVILTEQGHNKISTIKAIREVTRLDLRDAKDLCERAPTLLARAGSRAEANRIAQQFDGIAVVRIEQG